jgi:hypothetical protein
MAFIRWKHNGHGGRQAYLVHAYRGPDGKPKQKILTYLGNNAEFKPERLNQLKEKYPDLKINWEAIKPAHRPTLEVSTLSDADLLRKIRHLRHQLGLSQNHMVHNLKQNGLPPCSGPIGGGYPYSPHFGILEKALERGEPQDYYLDPLTEIAPALRLTCLSKM